MLRRSPLAPGLVLVLLIASIGALAPPTAGNGDGVGGSKLLLTVDGQAVSGWMSYPEDDPTPDTLLVHPHICCGHWTKSSFKAELDGFTAEHGVVAISTNYRGPGHWDVWNGHRDILAATEYALDAYPSIERTVIFGEGMGSEIAGMAVAERPDLYDFWVSAAGVSDLHQQFLTYGTRSDSPPDPDPSTPSHPINSWILEETGGLPGLAPEGAWEVRSPALRAEEMVGVTRVYLTHGLGDSYVAASQSVEMFEALREAGVPASLCMVATHNGGMRSPYVPRMVSWQPYYGNIQMGAPLGLAPHGMEAIGCTNPTLRALLDGGQPLAEQPYQVKMVDLSTANGLSTPVPSP